VARAFIKNMKAYFAKQNTIKRVEIGADPGRAGISSLGAVDRAGAGHSPLGGRLVAGMKVC